MPENHNLTKNSHPTVPTSLVITTVSLITRETFCFKALSALAQSSEAKHNVNASTQVPICSDGQLTKVVPAAFIFDLAGGNQGMQLQGKARLL